MTKAIKSHQYPAFAYLIAISSFVCFLVTSLILAPYVLGATPDGNGPWADEVVSASQGTRKDGSAVNADRSDSSQALGVAENTDVDGTFYSLGFSSGSLTLKFTNPIYNGSGTDLKIIESTRMPYELETANVEVSTDGVSFTSLGGVTQDGEVELPASVTCAYFVRITNTTNPELYEDTADGYDVDGVQALHTEGTCGSSEPSPTPTPSPSSGGSDPTPPPGTGGAPVCGKVQPGTPTLVAVNQVNSTTVEVFWTAVSPVTHYTLAYGTEPGNYQYGVPNTGNVTSYLVSGLTPGVTYYFAVYGVNECAPSARSNEVATSGAVGGQVLGATTTTLGYTGSFAETFKSLLAVLGISVSVAYFLFRKRLA